jgi:hypothetical protein
MSGDHAKREIMTGEKPATNTRRNPLPPSSRIGEVAIRRR